MSIRKFQIYIENADEAKRVTAKLKKAGYSYDSWTPVYDSIVRRHIVVGWHNTKRIYHGHFKDHPEKPKYVTLTAKEFLDNKISYTTDVRAMRGTVFIIKTKAEKAREKAKIDKALKEHQEWRES